MHTHMVSVVFRDVGAAREGRRGNASCRYGCEMTQPWWVMIRVGRKRHRGVAGDLRAAVGQGEDMSAQPKAIR